MIIDLPTCTTRELEIKYFQMSDSDWNNSSEHFWGYTEQLAYCFGNWSQASPAVVAWAIQNLLEKKIE